MVVRVGTHVIVQIPVVCYLEFQDIYMAHEFECMGKMHENENVWARDFFVCF